ncbi:MAG: COG3014 family protein [Pseudomonadota bacterium]
MARALSGRLPALLLPLTLLAGCATYSDRVEEMESALLAGQWERALEEVEDTAGDGPNEVLFHLNRGMLHRLNGDFEASNRDLERAKERLEALDAFSITETLGSLTVTEGSRAYVGTPHEQVMLHLIKAFNYLDLGELDSARVEALQVDLRLETIADAAGGSKYDADPFARYLTGLLYEALGEASQALVAYRMAHAAYQRQQADFGVAPPRQLQAALLRLTDHLGLDDEHAALRERYPERAWRTQTEYRRSAHVILILNEGLAPILREEAVMAQGRDGNLHRIALPVYQSRPWRLGRVELRADGERVGAELVQDVEPVARAVLAERKPGMLARSLARAVVGDAAVDEARDSDPLLGLLVNLFTVTTERADTRSWVTLPGRFRVARLSLPPGEYDLGARYGGGGVGSEVHWPDVTLRPGRHHFIIDHWISPNSVWRGGREQDTDTTGDADAPDTD